MDTMPTLGDAVGQRLTRDEVEAVCDLLDHAERLVREHDADEHAADQLADMIAALREGERRYR